MENWLCYINNDDEQNGIDICIWYVIGFFDGLRSFFLFFFFFIAMAIHDDIDSW